MGSFVGSLSSHVDSLFPRQRSGTKGSRAIAGCLLVDSNTERTDDCWLSQPPAGPSLTNVIERWVLSGSAGPPSERNRKKITSRIVFIENSSRTVKDSLKRIAKRRILKQRKNGNWNIANQKNTRSHIDGNASKRTDCGKCQSG